MGGLRGDQPEGRSGGGSGDVGRLRAGSPGEPRRPAPPGPQRCLPGEPLSQGVHTEARRAATTARRSHLGGQDRPTGGGRGAERHLRRGLPRLLLRVPAGTQAPRRTRCAGGRDRKEEGELDTRRGHPWVLRRHRPRVAPQVRRASDRGQAGPAAYPEMAERGSDRGRVMVGKRGGSPARGQRHAPNEVGNLADCHPPYQAGCRAG